MNILIFFLGFIFCIIFVSILRIWSEKSEEKLKEIMEKNRIEYEEMEKYRRRWGHNLFDENYETIKTFKLKCLDNSYNAYFDSSEVFIALNFKYIDDPELPNVGEKEMVKVNINGFYQHIFARTFESGDVLIFSKTEGKIIDRIMRKDRGMYLSDDPTRPQFYEYYLPDGTMFFEVMNFTVS